MLSEPSGECWAPVARELAVEDDEAVAAFLAVEHVLELVELFRLFCARDEVGELLREDPAETI